MKQIDSMRYITKLLTLSLFDYLERTRTSTSVNNLTKQKALDETRSKIIDRYLDTFSHMQLDIVEKMSGRSLSGVYKTRSMAGSTRSRASQLQAKKIVASTKLSFLEKERDLRKQMIELETQLNALKEHKNIALAEAEISDSEAESVAHSVHRDIKVEAPSSGERVKDYLDSLPDNPPVDDDLASAGQFTDNVTHGLSPTLNDVVPRGPNLDNQQAPQVIPQIIPMQLTPQVVQQMFPHIARTQMQINRFSHFDDRPETYPAWRSSFQSIARELSLKPVEELDLLMTYLGKDS